MRKIITYLCFAIFAVAIIMPRGWCCLVPHVNTQHTAPSSPNADSCPFCNHKESSDEDSGPKPFESPHPFTGFCCCEKVDGGLVEESATLDFPYGTQDCLAKHSILHKTQSSTYLARTGQFAYPNHLRIHVLNCQWLC